MSEPIKLGDMAMVLRTHCPHPTQGLPGVVVDVQLPRTADCPVCGKTFTACAAELDGAGWHPLQWLKRIPPLSELEGEKRDEEITA